MSKPKILILGAGYGGLMTAVRLTKELSNEDADITLVNKHNYHYESTWLHEVSAGTIHHDKARVLIKNVINPNRVNFVQDSVREIKKDEKKVILKNGELTYDYLVIALGFESATFGIKGLDEYAFAMRSINTARRIREHIDYQFANYNNDKNATPEQLAIVVGGGGFSGIELLGELVNRVPELCREYDIDPTLVKITNVEGASSILPGFDPELVTYAKNFLESKGVQFKLDTFIKEVTPDSVKIQAKGSEDLEEIKAGTIIWTGGVKANAIVENSGFETNRSKVPVKDDLRAPDDDSVFVVGDCALIMNEESGRPYPPTAQIALQEAYVIARNIKHILKNEPTETFVYKSKGTVASLGHSDAIGVVFGDKKLKGKAAATMKKVIDDRSLFLQGGLGLLLKKGKFKPF
ncbi:FAD-dependent oxidoreductase [Terrilactibacillus sp. BCM23-1]|uniref:FAD-dependent oxidoreductase n=1 Tax=Terrilactibacillus tamarindi TaxID=2599694 RepID=A0A6N8CP61_9BACI|nr:NAD(P)/FAD-dependent oxidoreductase [Terrilactibacillus tamarindi]MTT30655.1 FAD-dependent oxidoreductase [Terrilactibacillus tamarindi]